MMVVLVHFLPARLYLSLKKEGPLISYHLSSPPYLRYIWIFQNVPAANNEQLSISMTELEFLLMMTGSHARNPDTRVLSRRGE